MKVLVNKIPDEGIEIHSIENAETLGISPSEAVLDDNVHIEAKITSEWPAFFVDGSIKTVLNLMCSRCAVEFAYNVDTFFHCHEEPASLASTEGSLYLLKRDMDIDHYAGNTIEVNDIFREQLMLAVPIHPLCKPDCCGLCPNCGHNLNIGPCNCHIEETGSPFSVIKEILGNK